ncbi:MAG: hypothetical protein RI924_555 [Bacteroidota bacterium]|jgi:hypothetical protein
MKNLKNSLLVTGLLICSLSTNAFAQGRPKDEERQSRPITVQGQPLNREMRGRTPIQGMQMEKLEAAKIGFLTQKLDLSTKEAEKFWPVYNQYQKEMREVAKERMAKRRAEDQASAEERLNEQLEAESRVLDLRKKYTREFNKVISTEKVLRLFEAEKQFRQELIKRMQERRKY